MPAPATAKDPPDLARTRPNPARDDPAHDDPARDDAAPPGRRNGYREIAAVIQEWVRSERYRPGDRIPTEAELCLSFGVARVTVRRALAMLTQAGVLEARHGAGTFVAADYRPPPMELHVKLVGQRRETWGKGVIFRYLGERRVSPDAAACKAMGLGDGETLTEFAYLRVADGEPLEYAMFRFAARAAALIQDRSEGVMLHLNAYLRERGLTMSRTRRSIGAAKADARLAHLLGIAKAEPVVRHRGIAYDQFDRPYMQFEAYSRADRYEMDLDITVGRPAAAPGAPSGDVLDLWPERRRPAKR